MHYMYYFISSQKQAFEVDPIMILFLQVKSWGTNTLWEASQLVSGRAEVWTVLCAFNHTRAVPRQRAPLGAGNEQETRGS